MSNFVNTNLDDWRGIMRSIEITSINPNIINYGFNVEDSVTPPIYFYDLKHSIADELYRFCISVDGDLWGVIYYRGGSEMKRFNISEFMSVISEDSEYEIIDMFSALFADGIVEPNEQV